MIDVDSPRSRRAALVTGLAWIGLAGAARAASGGHEGHTHGTRDHGAMDHRAMDHGAASMPAPVALAVETGHWTVGKPVALTLHLSDSRGAPLTAAALRIVHEEKFHLLIVDDGLEDYHHLHPTPIEGRPGFYAATMTPRFDAPYRAVADVTPLEGRQTYAKTRLNPMKPPRVLVDARENLAAVSGVYSATLGFEETPRAGAMTMGSLQIMRNGAPFTALEPILGAFAHIVGFAAQGDAVVHAHPLGAEPKAADERAGPALAFHIDSMPEGASRLFVQIRADGRDVTLPFTVKAA